MARTPAVSRRSFLRHAAGAAAAASGLPALVARGQTRPSTAPPHVEFVVLADTHFLASNDNPALPDEKSLAINRALVDAINRLPGSPIPDVAGGGTVGEIRGVLHAGDIIDSGGAGGANGARIKQTEWNAFVDTFGLTGHDGALKCPVYELHGNHDGTGGGGTVIDGIIDRNRRRPGVANVSPNGLHYSWDWGPLHLVSLGIVVGASPVTNRRRRYAPLDSLAFLQADLARHVGTSGRPVVLAHHIDVARNCTEPNPAAPYDAKEWDPCDVAAYYDATEPYRVAAVFYGHTHARNVFTWDGRSPKAAAGLNVFNVDDASHYNGTAHAIFHVALDGDTLTVREYATKDNWQTAAWTKSWKRDLAAG
jgi:hypothetical protein